MIAVGIINDFLVSMTHIFLLVTIFHLANAKDLLSETGKAIICTYKFSVQYFIEVFQILILIIALHFDIKDVSLTVPHLYRKIVTIHTKKVMM